MGKPFYPIKQSSKCVIKSIRTTTLLKVIRAVAVFATIKIAIETLTKRVVFTTRIRSLVVIGVAKVVIKILRTIKVKVISITVRKTAVTTRDNI